MFETKASYQFVRLELISAIAYVNCTATSMLETLTDKLSYSHELPNRQIQRKVLGRDSFRTTKRCPSTEVYWGILSFILTVCTGIRSFRRVSYSIRFACKREHVETKLCCFKKTNCVYRKIFRESHVQISYIYILYLSFNIPRYKKNKFFIYIVANAKLNGNRNPIFFYSINLIYLIIKVSQVFIKSTKKIMSLTIPKRRKNQKTNVLNCA